MFAYLDLCAKLTDTAIVKRGQKLFLDGRVSLDKELTLDYWRQYKVVEQNVTYIINFPLIHLLLSKNKWKQAWECINELVTCQCEYWQEYGTCRHICGVCAHIDSELSNFNSGKSATGSNSSHKTVNPFSSLLEQVESANTEREVRQWLENWDILLTGKEWHAGSRWLSAMTHSISQNEEAYTTLWPELRAKLENQLKDFDKEKALCKILPKVLLYDGHLWWKQLEPIIWQISWHNQKQLWITLFLWREEVQINRIYKIVFGKLAVKLTPLKKLELLELLTEKGNTFETLIRFGIDVEYIQWLHNNLNRFDPQTLFEVFELIPDEIEKIDKLLLEQVKTWSLMAGNEGKEEVINIMQEWKRLLGWTDCLWLAVQYLRENHPKSRKLQKALTELEG
jgi:hypothetical protein